MTRLQRFAERLALRRFYDRVLALLHAEVLASIALGHAQQAYDSARDLAHYTRVYSHER